MSCLYHLILLSLVIGLSTQFSVDSTKKFILDDHGRYAIFHGSNVVYKHVPYIPITDHFDSMNSLSDEDYVHMKRLGFNLVRLGILWESVERQPGVYDMEYLKKMETIVNKLGENGIYTIIDAHQDLFAKNFCGNGFPPFYVEDNGYDKKCDASILAQILGLLKVCKPMSLYNLRYDEKGLPLREDCGKTLFTDFYFSSEVTSAFLGFYENKNGIQDKFIAFWETLAKTFKSNKYILGYDIINEPFPGGIWKNLMNIIPGLPDDRQLLPFYERVDKAIREIHPGYILFFENMPFPDFFPLFGGLILGKFKRKPADDKYPQVYNVHNYCCLSGPNACSGNEPTLETSKNVCPKYHLRKIDKNLKDADEISVPLIITEFGACTDSEACYNELISVVKPAEERFVSWAYWSYKAYGVTSINPEGIFNGDGTYQTIKETALTRAYVQYYQGRPNDFKYNDERTNFETSFTFDSSIEKPTRVYFNRQFNYPNGYNISVIRDNTKEQVKATFKEIDENYVDIEDISKDYDNTLLCIIFTAK